VAAALLTLSAITRGEPPVPTDESRERTGPRPDAHFSTAATAHSPGSGTLAQSPEEQARVAAAFGPAAAERPAFAPAIPGYELVGKLAAGGMGEVYRARDLKLKREVAIKTLRATDARPEVVARFWAEAEVMAAVKHPHVVQVFELGKDVTSPFIAMEYLSGGSLAKRLEGGAPMPAAEAAALVERVARGVAAAHELGIVHRDLKPGNVLFDEAGTPKVADFGLAKRTANDMTQTQALMGTPAYMAPEQAAGRAKFVGPPADVWALGVMLYECLCGARPFDGDTVETVLGQITSSEPAPLRARAPGLPRDLGTVVAKCLSKEPLSRYPTASELADDLGRFLRGEPIAARPPAWAERTRLWCRRHPVAAALLAVTGLFAVAQSATTVAAVRAYRAEKDAKAVAEARERAAEASAAESADMANLLVRLFETSAPLGFQPLNQEGRPPRLDDAAARELLAVAVRHVRSRPAAPSLARAELLDSLGSACRSRGLFAEAKELLNEALATRRQLLGDDNQEVAASLHNLGWLAQDEGRFREAEDLYRRALGMRREWLGDSHPQVTATMFNLAWVTAHQFDSAPQDRVRTAEAILRDILARQQRWPTGGHGDPVLTRVALALVIFGSDDPRRKAEAEAMLVTSLTLVPPDHPRSKPLLEAAGKYFRSRLHQEKREFPEAIELRREVLAAVRELFGREHVLVAAVLADLAAVLAKADQFDEAGAEFHEAMRIAKKNFPSGHWLIAKTMAEAGERFAGVGRHEEADRQFRGAMEMAAAVGRGDIWQRARAGRVGVLKSLKREGEAEALRKSPAPAKP
jgi:tetratricopeptide (TPR) repeat protein/tRNA A-37 threonylcarbamoyl transferase component Bud32